MIRPLQRQRGRYGSPELTRAGVKEELHNDWMHKLEGAANTVYTLSSTGCTFDTENWAQS